jgi:hypothetical protein
MLCQKQSNVLLLQIEPETYVRLPLVPKLQLGNALAEAVALPIPAETTN